MPFSAILRYIYINIATEAVVKKAFRDVHVLSIRRAYDGIQGCDASREIERLRRVIAEVNRRLGQETARRERLEQRLNALSARLTKTEAALQTAEGDRDAFRRDVELIEDHVIGRQADNGA
jgi:septal ring factor EnvC (AmiA/AmiB activator)